jgi:putative inorganic carbon (HCO3(-)) transporter
VPADPAQTARPGVLLALSACIQIGLVTLILWTPIPFGSVGRASVFGIEVMAIVLGLAAWTIVLLDPGSFPKPARHAMVPAIGILAIGVLQLLPLGQSWSALVAPKVHEVRELIGQTVSIDPATRVSLTPSAGIDALSRFTAYVWIAFAAAVGLRTRNSLRWVAAAIAFSASLQGLYGAFELLSGRQHILGYAKDFYTHEATGTFINRNHYAGYLAMAMPVTLALLSMPFPGTRFPGWRQQLLRLLQRRALLRALLLGGLGCIWIGVVLSYSRAGLAVAVIGTAIAAFGLWGRRLMFWLLVASLVVPTVFLLYKDVRTPGARLGDLAVDVRSERGRLPVWKETARMATHHWALGTGFGSFDAAFSLYRPSSIQERWQHAHNDWLQSAAEGGWWTPLLLVAIAIPVFRRRGKTSTSKLAIAIRLGALAGIVAVALHSVVDFPLKIPAVAVLAAILIGIRCGEIPAQVRIGKVR